MTQLEKLDKISQICEEIGFEGVVPLFISEQEMRAYKKYFDEFSKDSMFSYLSQEEKPKHNYLQVTKCDRTFIFIQI